MTDLVSGCSSGFGLLTALELARRGRTVAATMRDTSRADQLLDAAAAEDLQVAVHQLDVTDPQSVSRCVQDVTAAHGPVLALVNNAGIQMKGAVEDFDDDEVLQTLDTNLLGPIRLIRAVLPTMRTHRRGVIVNVTSVSGYTGMPGEGVYAASKHALEGLSESLHHELAPFDIVVRVVQPGGFPTSLGATGSSRRSGPNSAYHEDLSAFFAAINRFQGSSGPADPSLVASRIADAITASAPFRVPVGADAELTSHLHRTMPFEDFAAQLTQTLAWR